MAKYQEGRSHWAAIDGFWIGPPPASLEKLRHGLLNPALTSVSDSHVNTKRSKNLRVKNNVAAIFRAMGIPFNVKNAQEAHGIFLAARREYLQHNSATPNETARLVDEWIGIERSRGKNHPGVSTTKLQNLADMHRSWNELKANGGLMDLGQDLCEQPPSISDNEEPAPVQQEEAPTVIDLCSSDDASNHAHELEAAPISLERPARKTIERSSSFVSSTRPPKRQALEDLRGRQLDSSPPPRERLGPREFNSGEEDLDLSSELSSFPEDERHVLSRASPAFEEYQESANHRMLQCEEKLDEHNDWLFSQDLRSGGLEERVAEMGEEIADMKARLSLMEQPDLASAGDNGRPIEAAPRLRDDIRVLQQTIEDIERRLNRRSSYIRTQVKDMWTDMGSTLVNAQSNAGNRLDALDIDLRAQKSRIDIIQNELEDNVENVQGQQSRVTTLEDKLRKKIRVVQEHNSKLQARVGDLEIRLQKVEGLGLPSNSMVQGKQQKQDTKEAAVLRKNLDGLTKKIDKLEKANHHSSIGGIARKVRTLELGLNNSKGNTSLDQAEVEKRVSEQGKMITSQESMIQTLKKDMETMRAQLQAALPPPSQDLSRGHQSQQSQLGVSPRDSPTRFQPPRHLSGRFSHPQTRPSRARRLGDYYPPMSSHNYK
ncbi:hypothetical protein B0T22DRAFT_441498 [Podospora appendiculata]|uniref:Uncharacterized protein n=1 Tax=Podospora appendiculata TaxID=314037 RepID=A0AAE0XCF5_9PEZI|nr:hypothetical protein B0T22DRAFT_441498 [Podospora appendiculata]